MWKYYEIIQLTPETQWRIEQLTGLTYRGLRYQAINRILDGIMPDRTGNILYFIKNAFNDALRAKGLNVRVI